VTVIHQDDVTPGGRRPTAIVLAALMLFAAIAGSLAWNNWRRAAYTTEPFMHGDALSYVALMRSTDPAAIVAPFRYRLLTPFLARLAPVPPAWTLTETRQLTADQIAVMKFAMVNAVGLTVAALFLFLVLGQFGFGALESLLGSLLFLLCHLPSAGSLDPLVDAWGYACLAAGLWGLLTRRWGLVAAAFAIGLFNKETIALLPIAALLLGGWSRRERAILAGCFVPAAILYGLFRFVAFPVVAPLNPVAWYPAWAGRLLSISGAVIVPKALFASFGVLWIPAAAGWRMVEKESPLARLRPLAAIVFVAPLVLIKGPAHSWFYMFPVVIPLALLAMRAWLARWSGRER
jgi:hypothetical protein